MSNLLSKLEEKYPNEVTKFLEDFCDTVKRRDVQTLAMLNDYELIGYLVRYCETRVICNNSFVPNMDGLKEYVFGVFECCENRKN